MELGGHPLLPGERPAWQARVHVWAACVHVCTALVHVDVSCCTRTGLLLTWARRHAGDSCPAMGQAVGHTVQWGWTVDRGSHCGAGSLGTGVLVCGSPRLLGFPWLLGAGPGAVLPAAAACPLGTRRAPGHPRARCLCGPPSPCVRWDPHCTVHPWDPICAPHAPGRPCSAHLLAPGAPCVLGIPPCSVHPRTPVLLLPPRPPPLAGAPPSRRGGLWPGSGPDSGMDSGTAGRTAGWAAGCTAGQRDGQRGHRRAGAGAGSAVVQRPRSARYIGGAAGHGAIVATRPDPPDGPGSASECESPEHLTPFMPPGAEPGRMRWPGMSLWGVLWLWLPLASGHPVRLEKVRADTRNLTRTLSARIQQLQLFPLSLKISGLEAIPGEGAPEGLGAMDHRLQLFQRLLGGLAAGGLPLAQIANDMENLRSLLAALAAHLGCPLPRAPPAPPGLPDLLAEAPHTAAGLALARLRICLDSIAARLDSLPAC
ncbi:leptin isoform X1 [Falco cherrug]|nr:leptin isoform X1 [Falco cherrug]